MDKISLYFKESYNELVHKVTWPTWEELQNSAMIVLVSTIIFALIIFVMDLVFGANPENQIFRGILGWVYRLIIPGGADF